MKNVLSTSLTSAFLAGTAFAGHLVTPPAKQTVTTEESPRTFFPDTPAGLVTLGAQFSESATGGYIDSITGLWASTERDSFLFLNSRYHLEDNDQFISSTGLGFRKMFRNPDVIVGANVYWDSIHSDRGNDFDQLGFGVEVLTQWVDARFNYYVPENDRYEVGRSTVRHEGDDVIEKLTFKQYESTLEGFNAEIGLLIPGLGKYLETRIYGGYYRYDNPFGGHIEGFKARLEARLLRGVIAEVEYWEDEELMGGNWTAGISVSVPFSIYNLIKGRNPFEGFGDSFKPGPRDFADRMSEMVERSHRIQTITSNPILASRTIQTETASRAVIPFVPPASQIPPE